MALKWDKNGTEVVTVGSISTAKTSRLREKLACKPGRLGSRVFGFRNRLKMHAVFRPGSAAGWAVGSAEDFGCCTGVNQGAFVGGEWWISNEAIGVEGSGTGTHGKHRPSCRLTCLLRRLRMAFRLRSGLLSNPTVKLQVVRSFLVNSGPGRRVGCCPERRSSGGFRL